jgi:hypothetical protein
MENCIQNESNTHGTSTTRQPVECVQAALTMLQLMPDHPNVSEAYRVLPWWSLLHFVCQAAAVLIMELCLC